MGKKWASSSDNQRTLWDLPHKEIWNGIEIIRLSSFRTEPFRAKMKAMTGFILSAVWYCLFKMKDFQPDMIHVHFAVPVDGCFTRFKIEKNPLRPYSTSGRYT
jgi:hypothetical protein